MLLRRDFIKAGGLAAAGIASGFSFAPVAGRDSYISKRPAPAERNFSSQIIEQTIKDVKKAISDKELAWLFENCFPNTLDTTVKYQVIDGKPDTFVITGDIEAMWLRDSTAQVWPYIPFANKEKELRDLLAGVINRQTSSILIDPYANAFNEGPTGSEWENDLTDMKPELHERKWEIDSLCYPIRLAYAYWKATGDTSCFGNEWEQAMKLVVDTFKTQQRKEGRGPYKFQRVTGWQTDTVAGAGYGNPINPVGLISSTFRPSDDATIYLFLIPSNCFAIVSLRQLAEMSEEIMQDPSFASTCTALAEEVQQALNEYAVSEHLDFGKVYPFEVDGFGNELFMDDANIPSLLSLPYLNYCAADDPVYQNTRNFVLSKNNPYFFEGSKAEGIGSPHVGLDMIWPMSITMRAITSNSDQEIRDCLKMLKNTHGDTGFMHEAFHKDNPENFTREWFAWSNTLFGELILKVYQERPHLLKAQL